MRMKTRMDTQKRNQQLAIHKDRRSWRSWFDCATTSLWAGQVMKIARGLGASAREAATLSAIFDLEGFGGLEYDLRFAPVQVVGSELTRLRMLTGKLHAACVA